jgi:hypothetical protein
MNYLNKLNNLNFVLKDINNLLDSKCLLNLSQIIHIQDELNQIELNSNQIKIKSKNKKNIVLKKNNKILNQIINIYQKIEEIENIRIVDDEFLLKEMHKLLLSIDMLSIHFSKITYSEIEKCLDLLDQKYDDLLHIRAFNQNFIGNLFKLAKDKLDNLKFRFNFPIVEELNENKDSFAHRAIFNNKNDNKKLNYIKNKLLLFKNLSEIAKEFLYKDDEKASLKFKNLCSHVKSKIKENVYEISFKKIKDLNMNKNEILANAIMKHISQEINNF